MTNPAMDAVKAVYPDAKCIFVTHNFSYYITSAKGTRGVGGRLSEYMWSIEDAWQSAESRLVPAPEVGESKVFDQKLHDECIKCRCKSEGRFPCDICQRAWHQAWDLVEGKITKAAPPVAEVVGPIKSQLQCQVCGCDIDFDDFCNRCRKTLDVERASKWLDVNGFMGGGLMKRGIAELLHDYSLTVAAPPPLTEGDRWVDCRQELPPDEVLVIVHGGVAKRLSGDWITETGMAAGRTIQWEVTHWMPMPAPPKLTASPDLTDEVQKHGVFNICHERSPRDKSRCHREFGHDGRHTSRNDGWYTSKADLEVEGDK